MMKKILSAAVVASVVMVGALPAFAEEDPVPVYDEDEHILMFAVEGECMIDADMDIVYTFEDDGSITFEVVVVADESSVEAPPSLVFDDSETVDPFAGCHPFSVEGPNGQVNHGTFVSNLMHALKELGIKGSDKKEYKAALAGFGKGDMQVKAHDDDEAGSTTDDSATLTGDASDHPGKPDKGNQSNKSSNGRGHNK